MLAKTLKIMMSVMVVLLDIYLFLIVIGNPVKYEDIGFLADTAHYEYEQVLSPEANYSFADVSINVSSARTVKRYLPGVTSALIDSSPYKIYIRVHCPGDGECLPEIDTITATLKDDKTNIPLDILPGALVLSPSSWEGRTGLSEAITLNHEFRDNDVFTVSLKFKDNPSGLKYVSWDVRHEFSERILFVPLWVRATS